MLLPMELSNCVVPREGSGSEKSRLAGLTSTAELGPDAETKVIFGHYICPV